ncbi:aliphatic sulfonate ABC transporter substrate-binding protein [Celeribacter indicus]|uniref:Putative aliphatic sulfonates-binding protein n=1 Tax=Celeribacter indicus TaxID=1208324 RepID=A0A0B5E154_9RHOB|nr:aliphatic sulfonate ABC transporter substrate-binding protein [Celeribacter indicus]AJE46157.1 aliphatic sulfonates family ABC transporter periplasmic ligand-binding protein [Celeribacter indicus]SDX36634.1 sulfonate transport system substrate-binding protein [Celeribacter indicus]
MKFTGLKALATVSALLLTAHAAAAEELKQITVAWSKIVPETVLAKERGWVEEAVAPYEVEVKWVESLGSNKTVEFLRGESLDVGTLSLASAFLARANGTPIRYVYWTARDATGAPLLVAKDSEITSYEDLKGKKIAATPGTGPHVALLAGLKKHGLSETDVEVVSLPHSQGRLALATGRVDAWSGLEPDWSIAEIETGATVLYADPELAGGGGIAIRDDILEDHPEIVAAVLSGYDRARQYTLDNLDASIEDFAKTSGVSLEVAASVVRRNDITRPALIPEDRQALINWGNIYNDLGSIPADTDVAAVVDAVLDYDVFRPEGSQR